MAEQEKTPARVGKVVQQATVLFTGAEITAVLIFTRIYGDPKPEG